MNKSDIFPTTSGNKYLTISTNVPGFSVVPAGDLQGEALRVLEFLSHFLAFIIATGPVALRTNHGNKAAGSNTVSSMHYRMNRWIRDTSGSVNVSAFVCL